MLANKAGYFVIPAKAGANVLMLVSSDGYAVAGAANQNAASRFAAFNSGGHRVRKVGVINGSLVRRAEVFYRQTFALEHFNNHGFVFKAGMVGADGDGFGKVEGVIHKSGLDEDKISPRPSPSSMERECLRRCLQVVMVF